MNEVEEQTSWRDGLWNIAGFKKKIVQDSEMSGFHASLIGSLVVMVGIYAAFAWFFFFQTVTDNLLIAGLGGLFFGGFIVLFDRALIASMASGGTKPISLLFRFGLAILIGVFLSQPIVLKLYEPEIARESSILMDQVVQERKLELEKIYSSEVEQLEAKKEEIQTSLNDQLALVQTSEQDFKSEMDGSSGTGIYGYSTVAKRKEALMIKHQGQLEKMDTEYGPVLTKIDEDLATIQDKITTEIADYRADNKKAGTLIQVAALESLMEKDESGALRNRYILLAIILTLIELSALIVKLFLPTASYKSRARFIDEEEITQSELGKEIALNQWKKYRELTLENEQLLVEQFFEESQKINREKVGTLLEEWKKSTGETYGTFWQRFKETYLMK